VLESAGYELLKEDKTKTGRVFITVLNTVNRARTRLGMALSLDDFLLHFFTLVLKMAAKCSSETSIDPRSSRHYNYALS
jgi:hypothetical protein